METISELQAFYAINRTLRPETSDNSILLDFIGCDRGLGNSSSSCFISLYVAVSVFTWGKEILLIDQCIQ